ncbi:hypothetical protein [Embleya sp. NPDC059237]|uniref:hypothetical protein n=1 Tax=Embleya sp. NPDC059237 TaxID=3346784 RepID=UPI003693D6DE
MYDLTPGVGYAATVALRGPGPDTVRECWVDAVSAPDGAEPGGVAPGGAMPGRVASGEVAPDRSDAGAADGQ